LDFHVAVVEGTFLLSAQASDAVSQLLMGLGVPLALLPNTRHGEVCIRREIYTQQSTSDDSKSSSGLSLNLPDLNAIGSAVVSDIVNACQTSSRLH
jgi:hypothetical protein